MFKYIPAPENKKYISPDLKIDASTCLFPERTWFIKDLHHDFFGPLQEMSMELMRYDTTVDNEKYPQFLTCTGENTTDDSSLFPTTGTDEDATKPKDSIAGSLIRFITAIFNLFTELLKGNFNLSFNFDVIR